MNSVSLDGVNVYPFLDRANLLEFAVTKKNILIAINAEKIINQNDKLKKIINRNIGYPDGIGAVLALRKKGYKAVKIPGVELWLDIAKSYFHVKTFYLVGASEEVIQSTVLKLQNEFIGIKILGYHNGFFDENIKKHIIKDISIKKPDIVFVAMGTPKQEYLMDEMFKVHHALYVGLGGSFDVYTGKVKRAPRFFQFLGIEWTYRLIKQPSRIIRQYVLLRFSVKLLFNNL